MPNSTPLKTGLFNNSHVSSLPPILPERSRAKSCLCLEGAVEGLAGGEAGVEGDGFERKVVVGRIGKQQDGLTNAAFVDICGEWFAVDGIYSFRDHVTVNTHALRQGFEIEIRVEVDMLFVGQAAEIFHQGPVGSICLCRRHDSRDLLRPFTATGNQPAVSLMLFPVKNGDDKQGDKDYPRRHTHTDRNVPEGNELRLLTGTLRLE